MVTRIYADRGAQRTPEEREGLPREVLRELVSEGWTTPYVVQELADTPKPDARQMPWADTPARMIAPNADTDADAASLQWLHDRVGIEFPMDGDLIAAARRAAS